MSSINCDCFATTGWRTQKGGDVLVTGHVIDRVCDRHTTYRSSNQPNG
jgi:hypothetical protein